MINLFKNKAKSPSQIEEETLRMRMVKRAEANSNARKSAKMTLTKGGGDVLSKIDAILDKVGGFENSKITAITELYLALESGDDKNLIKFLKQGDKIQKKTTVKKKSKTWNS